MYITYVIIKRLVDTPGPEVIYYAQLTEQEINHAHKCLNAYNGSPFNGY